MIRPRCPNCREIGNVAAIDQIEALAIIETVSNDGSEIEEYFGESKIIWDSQEAKNDPVQIICRSCGYTGPLGPAWVDENPVKINLWIEVEMTADGGESYYNKEMPIPLGSFYTPEEAIQRIKEAISREPTIVDEADFEAIEFLHEIKKKEHNDS